jgi:hypothetical protein
MFALRIPLDVGNAGKEYVVYVDIVTSEEERTSLITVKTARGSVCFSLRNRLKREYQRQKEILRQSHKNLSMKRLL